MQHQEDPTDPGWYADPTEPARQRYWDGRWTKQTRVGSDSMPAGVARQVEGDGPDYINGLGTDAPARRSHPDRNVFRLRRVLVAAVILLLLAAVAFGIWYYTLRGDAPAPKDDQLDGLVYEFASPRVPCCTAERTEGTAEFTVDGAWHVQWQLEGQGEDCSVVGRIVDPSTNRFADLKPFGSGPSGKQDYAEPGTYSIALKYDCPAESIAMAQVRVFEDGV